MVQVAAGYRELSSIAAALVCARVRVKQDLVLGLPAGRTPLGLYSQLVNLYRAGLVDFSGVTTFNLDEYYPVPPQDPRSFYAFTRRHFLDHVNVPANRAHAPAATHPHPAEACAAYELEIVRAGGLDLVILGIGQNGHIGFNEPGTAFDSRTRLVELAEHTVRVNFGRAAAHAPRAALSMGIATIMEAAEVLLLASGRDKAPIVGRSLCGPVTPEVPASILQRHPLLTAVVDREAAAAMGNR
ncbi:MAG TPA: glucosamine-6-phosphate deaminase [Clostridiales bacterium UBA8153]|nr:glucosamine-6-phosphate deaminase [Clostridiales bacterium UBA8153]